jgi:phosphatidylethanolamine N-methyltransferase
MAEVKHDGSKADSSQLRERPSAKPLHLHNSDDAKQRVLELNEQEEKHDQDEDKRKTYGRVPDGTGKL